MSEQEKTKIISNPFKDTRRMVWVFCLSGFILTSLMSPYLYITYNSNVSFNHVDEITPSSESEYFDNPEIQANSASVFDIKNNTFIYSKNSKSQLPLASITKVASGMSAIRIAQKTNSNKNIKFSGKWWNLYDLLKFSLVSSSNIAIANISKALSKITDVEMNESDREIDFIYEMNLIAKELGLNTLYFVNETGLDLNEDAGGAFISGAYGTSEDVAKMFSYAINEYPEIFNATKYSDIQIESEDGDIKFSKNTNTEINKTTMAIASKTGTTDLAGGNLVIAFDAGISRPIIISILGSTPEGRFEDAKILIKDALRKINVNANHIF